MSNINVEELVGEYLQAKQVPKPTAAGTLMRCSDAGSCERARSFKAAEIPPSELFDTRTLIAFELGNSLHEVIQAAFSGQEDFEFESEAIVTFEDPSISISGHTDGIITFPSGKKIILEIKTMSGYGAKTTFSSGPKRSHVAQAGLYALGADAQGVLIVYVSKESVMRSPIKPGSIASWYYDMEDEVYADESLSDVVAAEIERFARPTRAVERGMIAEALICDDDGYLNSMEPSGGYGTRTKWWECGYCLYNSLCHELGPGEVPVSAAKRLMEG